MSELCLPSRSTSNWQELLQIPEDITLSRFMLNYFHPLKPQQGTPCLVEAQTGRKSTISQLRSRTMALATALHSQYDIGKDDVVMICSPNHIDYPVIIWAVHTLGGIVTLSNPKYTKHELIQQIRLTKASLIILHSSVLDTIPSDVVHLGVSKGRIISLADRHRLMPYPSVEDLVGGAEHCKIPMNQSINLGGDRVAMLALSSGTTGAPKAVKLSHRGIIVNILQMAAHIASASNPGFAPGDVALQTLPFFHVAGFVLGLHLCLFLQAIVITEQYDFLRMLQDIVRFDVTTLVIVPPQAITLCKHPATKYFSLDSLKKIFVGAAPVSSELQQSLAAAVPSAQIGQLYGLTEASCTLAMTRGSHSTPGSAGQLLPGIETRVLKSDGSLVHYGERGELYIRTLSAALGYLDNMEASVQHCFHRTHLNENTYRTRETFHNDGWVRTGDEVLVTKEQEIFVFDRVKDVIKVKGFQVTPAELEGCLLGHPDVLDAAIIGVPHDYSGQVPFAFVVIREAAEQEINEAEYEHAIAELKASILKFVSDRTAPYKRISGVQFVSSIPKTSSGKVLRRALQKDWQREKAKL
ncbi:hypothetical protein BDP27DRAFT_1419273 [Rhodocollybia butyracea]|uniref:4-coumarate--CoA ligase n=1 Tax=Rhodocollybia butyracea TaxID=206335 RepID=A0A9P5PZR8_9AGAR|nr:hypothetical protein BDP27DRAFT_1419273 [Rhodocollybia butyracea]